MDMAGWSCANPHTAQYQYTFPRCFPDKQRLISSRPDAILIVTTKRATKTNSRYPLRGRGGRRGNREHSPASKVRHPSHLLQNRGTSILWRSNTVKLRGPRISSRPPSSSTAIYVTISSLL
eukprot:1155585-Pelagomonas_calceolata.AAC.6